MQPHLQLYLSLLGTYADQHLSSWTGIRQPADKQFIPVMSISTDPKKTKLISCLHVLLSF